MNVFKRDIFDFMCTLDGRAVQWGQGAVTVEDACGQMVCVVPVPIDFFRDGGSGEMLLDMREAGEPGKTIFLYEDRWLSCGTLVRSMLRTIVGKGETVFARNTEVREIPAKVAADFLQKNHLYGPTRSEYRYGLFRTRSTGAGETLMGNTSNLIAVATFSGGKPFEHAVSYEWIRYASLAGTRVVGGMGKLLNAFLKARTEEQVHIEEQVSSANLQSEQILRDNSTPSDKSILPSKQAFPGKPIEVMSYADLEWGDGESYRRLGFKEVAERESVKFLVDPQTYSRIHADKLATDRKFRDMDSDGLLPIYNLGSRKYVLHP